MSKEAIMDLHKESKSKVLIIDDVPQNIKLLASILYEEGVSIWLANNGKQGIEIAKKEKPDLILLDIAMPGINGYEVCQYLKGNDTTRHIPIIFLSAKNESKDIVYGLHLGAIDYITKPFNAEELLSKVFTHLELKHTKDLIESQKKELEQLNTTKDKLFSVIGHDLRNPLSNIIGFSELLVKHSHDYSPEKIERFANYIYSTSLQTHTLLESLLEWSRHQRKHTKYDPQIYQLKEQVSAIIDFLNQSAKNKQIELTTKIAKDIRVKADANMLNTILRNLINNAIKFTEPGGEIKISAKVQDQQIEISVADTGVGMTKKEIEGLFNLETSESKLGTAQEKGTGLGLLLCYEFVKQHKGDIWVDSKPGKGSRFTFTIPGHQQDELAVRCS